MTLIFGITFYEWHTHFWCKQTFELNCHIESIRLINCLCKCNLTNPIKLKMSNNIKAFELSSVIERITLGDKIHIQVNLINIYLIWFDYRLNVLIIVTRNCMLVQETVLWLNSNVKMARRHQSKININIWVWRSQS